MLANAYNDPEDDVQAPLSAAHSDNDNNDVEIGQVSAQQLGESFINISFAQI